MSEDILRAKVTQCYTLQYPKWKEIRVTRVVPTALSGSLAVVHAEEDGKSLEGEVCHISPEGSVKIFSTTEELVNHLESELNRKWYDKLLSRQGISAIVTLVLLFTLCILAFLKSTPENAQVTQILGGAFLATIGFFFGTSGK